MTDKEKTPSWNPDFITDISERIYRKQLDAECGAGTADKPRKPGAISIRDRAKQYDRMTRYYLAELGFTPPAEK